MKKLDDKTIEYSGQKYSIVDGKSINELLILPEETFYYGDMYSLTDTTKLTHHDVIDYTTGPIVRIYTKEFEGPAYAFLNYNFYGTPNIVVIWS